MSSSDSLHNTTLGYNPLKSGKCGGEEIDMAPSSPTGEY